MAISTFASIYIGSYEITLKIFEFSQKKNMHQIDFVRSRVDLGKDIYQTGIIGVEVVDDLCLILNEFRQIMDSYRVENYNLFATAAIRDAKNRYFVKDQILMRTGFEFTVIGNSRHRLLSYKAVAGQPAFEKLIQTSAAVVDVGGDSVQITLFKKGQLVTTQRIEVGTMRLLSLLNRPGITKAHYQQEIGDYIDKNFDTYSHLYLEETGVESVIFLSDYGVELVRFMDKESGKEKEVMKAERFLKYIQKFDNMTLYEITRELHLSDDQDPLILPSIQLFKSLVQHLKPAQIWFPGVDINDGIAFDFAQTNQLIRSPHDFDTDVISAARQLASHYQAYEPHTENLEKLSAQVFDTMKKIHGLDRRHLLLLRVAAILHDCGKYVSFSNGAHLSYEIIKSSEIIGISHEEREIIASAVLYNVKPLEEYSEVAERMSRENYLVVAKLAAILRVANALDQSHKQKIKNIRIAIKDRQLVITVDALANISLEEKLFAARTELFESVFSMKPVLKEKRVYNLKK